MVCKALPLVVAILTTRAYDQAVIVSVDGNTVLGIVSADVDLLSGEELATKATEAADRLQIAFAEAVELRSPVRLVIGSLQTLAATVLWITALWILVRTHRWLQSIGDATVRASAERAAHVRGRTPRDVAAD